MWGIYHTENCDILKMVWACGWDWGCGCAPLSSWFLKIVKNWLCLWYTYVGSIPRKGCKLKKKACVWGVECINLTSVKSWNNENILGMWMESGVCTPTEIVWNLLGSFKGNVILGKLFKLWKWLQLHPRVLDVQPPIILWK